MLTKESSGTQEPGTSRGNTGIRAALAPTAAVEGPLVLLAIPFGQKLVITFHSIASAFCRPPLIHKFTSHLVPKLQTTISNWAPTSDPTERAADFQTRSNTFFPHLSLPEFRVTLHLVWTQAPDRGISQLPYQPGPPLLPHNYCLRLGSLHSSSLHFSSALG